MVCRNKVEEAVSRATVNRVEDFFKKLRVFCKKGKRLRRSSCLLKFLVLLLYETQSSKISQEYTARFL